MRRSRTVPAFLLIFFLALAAGHARAWSLPAQDVQPINNKEYFPAVLDLLNHASQNIRMVMYLAQRYEKFPDSPSNQLLDALIHARQRGVDVQVILERPASKTGYAMNRDLSNDLLQKNTAVKNLLADAHVEVYEDSERVTTHAKLLVVDSRYTVVGSTNWTYAALALNNETAVIIDSTEIAQRYMALFDQIKVQR